MENINVGTVEAPYQEWNVTIPANGVKRIDYVTDNFFLYEVSAHNALQVNFGGAVNQTFFTDGIGYRLTQPVPYLTLKNTSNQPLTIKFAAGVGDIFDNRLVVSGTVYTQPAQYSNFAIANETITSGKATIAAGGGKNIIQNNGSNVMYIGGSGTDGLKLEVGGSFEYAGSFTLDVWGTDNDIVTVGSFS